MCENFKIAQLGQIHKVENPKTLNPRDLCICTHFRRFLVVRLLSTAELFFGCCLHKGRTRAGRKDLHFTDLLQTSLLCFSGFVCHLSPGGVSTHLLLEEIFCQILSEWFVNRLNKLREHLWILIEWLWFQGSGVWTSVNLGMMTNANNKLECFVLEWQHAVQSVCVLWMCGTHLPSIWQTSAKKNLAPRNVMVVRFNSCGYFESVC